MHARMLIGGAIRIRIVPARHAGGRRGCFWLQRLILRDKVSCQVFSVKDEGIEKSMGRRLGGEKYEVNCLSLSSEFTKSCHQHCSFTVKTQSLML